jgi:hypothetical protein
VIRSKGGEALESLASLMKLIVFPVDRRVFLSRELQS